MALNVYQWQSERSTKRLDELYNIDTLSSLSTQMEILSKKIDKLSASAMHVKNVCCDYCGKRHASIEC